MKHAALITIWENQLGCRGAIEIDICSSENQESNATTLLVLPGVKNLKIYLTLVENLR